MFKKFTLLLLTIHLINGQIADPKTTGAEQSYIFDLPPLQIQPLQLRLNPSSSSLFLVNQNESIPIETLGTTGSGFLQTQNPSANQLFNSFSNAIKPNQLVSYPNNQPTFPFAPLSQSYQPLPAEATHTPALQPFPTQTNFQPFAPQRQNYQQIFPKNPNLQVITPESTNFREITSNRQNFQTLTPKSSAYPNFRQTQTFQPFSLSQNIQTLPPQIQSYQLLGSQLEGIQSSGAQNPNIKFITPQSQNFQVIAQGLTYHPSGQPQSFQPLTPQTLQSLSPFAPQAPQPLAQQTQTFQPSPLPKPTFQPLTSQIQNIQSLTPQTQSWQPLAPQNPNLQPLVPHSQNLQPLASQTQTLQPLASQNLQPSASQNIQPWASQNIQPWASQTYQPLPSQNIQPLAFPKQTFQPLNFQPLSPQLPALQPLNAFTNAFQPLPQSQPQLQSQPQPQPPPQPQEQPQPLTPPPQPYAYQFPSIQQFLPKPEQNIPKESTVNYAIPSVESILKDLSKSYTPDKLPAQDVIFQQLAPGRATYNQLFSQQYAQQVGRQDKNTRYFPELTLPALTLPPNEFVQLVSIDSQQPQRQSFGIPNQQSVPTTTEPESDTTQQLPPSTPLQPLPVGPAQTSFQAAQAAYQPLAFRFQPFQTVGYNNVDGLNGQQEPQQPNPHNQEPIRTGIKRSINFPSVETQKINRETLQSIHNNRQNSADGVITIQKRAAVNIPVQAENKQGQFIPFGSRLSSNTVPAIDNYFKFH